MLQSPEMLNKIALWRAKADQGTMTIEDWKQAMTDLRASRGAAQAAQAAAKKAGVNTRAPKAPARSTEDLKAGLRGLLGKK